MTNKKMRTMAFCLTLALTVCNCSSISVQAAETEQWSEEMQAETKAPETQAETKAPETQAETKAPETEPETKAPETQLPGETQTEKESDKILEEETEKKTDTETGDVVIEDIEVITEAEAVDSGNKEEMTETGSETEGVSELESETESESEGLTIEESEEETEPETSEYASNEELIAHQNIVIPPKLTLEFRFTQVEKQIALARRIEGTFVYENKTEDARAVGRLNRYGICYILEASEDGWYYVESGQVRGFVKKSDMIPDVLAARMLANKSEDAFALAEMLVPRRENKAFSYTHTTVQQTVVPKIYAVAAENLNIRESKCRDSRVIGKLAKDGLCYLLADTERQWIFVESGDARGFVMADNLLMGSTAEQIVQSSGEDHMEYAVTCVSPDSNHACYYTLTSVKEASKEAKQREEMVNFAVQFLGNPYMWGGTSLTNGCDCSGFVQSVYAHFGYYLPRVADAQSVCGMQIPVSEAQPGDLIFYAKKGSVYHVSMYIGGGRVVQAANKRSGIITSGIGGDAVWATRVIQE